MKDVITFEPSAGGPVSYFALLRSATADGGYSVVATASAEARVFSHPVSETGAAFYAVRASGPGGESGASEAADNSLVAIAESVSPEGRVLASSNGEVVLSLPAGAFGATTDVGVTEVSASPTGGLISLSGVYEITPSGTLSAPAVLSVRYTLAVTHYQVVQTLVNAAEIMTYDAPAGGWIAGASGVTADGTYLSGTLDHFSYWTGAVVEPHGTAETTYCSDGGICHDLSTYPGSTVRYDSRDSQVCYNCHGNTSAALPAAGANGPNVEGQLYQCDGQTRPVGSTIHPVASGDLYCTICHDPHADPAASPGLLRAWDPLTGTYVQGGSGSGPGDRYCWACHGTVVNKRTNYYVPNYWANSGGDRKTGYVGTPHATIETDSDVTCTACHAEHGSDEAALVLDEIETPGGAVSVSRTSDVCLGCHTESTMVYPGNATAGATKHVNVTSSTRALTRNPGSTAEGQGCTGCHEPHGKGAGASYTWVGGRDLCLTCHDAGGLTYGADYSYQGPTEFGASGHAGLTGGLGYLSVDSSSDEFAAWESATLPTPSSPGTPVDAAGTVALKSADDVLLTTDVQTTTGQSDYQMYRFKMPADKADVATIALTWRGYGEAAPGYPVTISAWNSTTNGWQQIDSRQIASEQQLILNLTPANHIDASGYVYVLAQAKYVYDAAIVSGPTISAPYAWNPSLYMVQWTTAGLSSSLVDYGPTTAYGTTVGSADERVTNHVVWLTMPAGITHMRARSASSFGESAASADTIITYPKPTIVSTNPSSLVWYDVPVSTTLTWNAMAAPGGPFQYRVQVLLGGSQVLLTDWTTDLSYVYSTSTPGGYSWRVEARDASQTSYGWSAAVAFGVADGNYTGSCPFLFTWDGEKMAFEADLFTAARVGGRSATGFQQPNPNDAYVLANAPEEKDGSLEFSLVEERYEVDYLDSFGLYAVDAPVGTTVYAQKAVAGTRAFPPLASAIHTVRELTAPVSAVRTDTGADVSFQVAADDGIYLELNENRETTFTYKTIELDLGPGAASAPQVKIVMDAVTEFPVTPAGIARRFTFGLPSKLEVQNADGTWRTVPSSVGAVPVAPEFTRPYVFDLTSAMAGTTGRVRFTYLFRTLVDSIGVDMTADEPVTITPVELTGADLRYHGVDEELGTAGDAHFVYGEDLADGSYFPGMYTRFGDVSELLTARDDKFVIMGQGDEIALTFAVPDEPVAGTERSYVVSVLGYYKDLKTDVSRTVEPLPFAAMSNYPYAADERYPDDAEHQAYQALYNTRVDGRSEAIGAANALAVVLEGAVAALRDALPLASASTGESDLVAHRSLNTDLVSLEVAVTSASGAGGECGVCHAMHGSTEQGQPLTGGRIASDGRTCTANGSGGCHDNAANSASGIDIRAQFTANSSPTAHHDVLLTDQAASGGRTSCADCHNPHQNNGTDKVSNPDDIASPVTTALTSVIPASGEVYLLAGAKHDGNPPVISGVALSGPGTQYASPFITWTTDEPATTWVDWGLTTAYSETPVGTNTLSVSHSAQLTGLVAGTTYHYRVRSADALGNSSVSADFTYTPVSPPPTPAISDHTTFSGSGVGPISVTVSCSTVAAPDSHPVEYQFEFNGAAYYTSPWVSGPSWLSTAWFFNGTHTVRVRARDAVHTQAVSAWSSADSFTVTNASFPPSSCPFVFVWNGESFSFEADISTTGKLAEKTSTGYSRPDPRDRYKLTTEPQLKDGALEIRLVEERLEIDYTDEVALYAVDLPEGMDVYAEKGVRGAPGAIPPDGLHTVTDLRTPVTVRTDTGEDVTGLLSAVDGSTLILNESREQFEYKTLEMDLGDVSDAPQVKIVMNAQSARPLTAAGIALQRAFSATTVLEVQNLDGTWRKVPSSEAILPNAMEFPRSYVFEIGPAMHDTTGRVRFTFLFKTYIDMIGFDTSADLPIEVVEVPLLSGTLAYHGIDAKTNEGEVYDFVYGDPASAYFFPPGDYTKYGDVTPLLDAADDRFVIWGPGDEITLRFEPLDVPAEGLTREYVLFSETYYKSQKSDTPFTVELLPFAAMSNYPYSTSEHYPDDAEHQAYRAEWNTRVNGVESASISGSSVSWLGYHVTTPLVDQGMFSVDTDYAAVRTLVGTTATYVQAAAGWQSASVEASKPTPSAPGTAVAAATLDAADTDNSAYWQTDLASTDSVWNWQLMRFDLGTDALDELKALSIMWNGHGEPTAGYSTAVFIWNPGTGAWEELSRFVSGTDRAVSVERRALDDSFCLKCHDGTPPSGVVFPAATKNVGASWTGAAGDFHGGGSGGGLGSALAVPYVRGNSAIACGTCHEAHGNANVYHFPTWINGTSGISVPTTSSGAAQVCGSCHVSGGGGGALVDQYHAACLSCHNAEGHGPGSFVGSDCLSCHKHGTTWDHYANLDPAYYNAECHCGVPGPYKTF